MKLFETAGMCTEDALLGTPGATTFMRSWTYSECDEGVELTVTWTPPRPCRIVSVRTEGSHLGAVRIGSTLSLNGDDHWGACPVLHNRDVAISHRPYGTSCYVRLEWVPVP